MGAVQVALAAISWSFAGALSKSLPWNSLTINGVRSLVAAILLAFARGGVRVRLTRGTLLGAAGTALTGILYMVAVKLTTSANAIVLQYAMPAFVILFSWVFYGQKPGARQLVIAACIMAAVLLAFARRGVKVKLTKGTLLGAAGTALTGVLYMIAV